MTWQDWVIALAWLLDRLGLDGVVLWALGGPADPASWAAWKASERERR